MSVEDIYKELQKIRNLPTLPRVINKLKREVSNPNAGARQVAKIIENDPSMMAKIMKVVNSAFYGNIEPITSVQHAVARMGFNAVNNIALSTSVFSAFDDKKDTDFNREEFWKHCITTGLITEIICDRFAKRLNMRYPKDIQHLAGLLHDIGRIIFEQYFHDKFILALKETSSNKQTLYRNEQKFIGADHAQVGAWLGEKWKLSEDLIQVIRWHHKPEEADEKYQELARICHCANYLCNFNKIGESGDSATSELVEENFNKLGMEISKIDEYSEIIMEESVKSEILLAFV